MYLENPRVQEARNPECSASPDIDLYGVSLAAGEDRENGFGMRSGVLSSVGTWRYVSEGVWRLIIRFWNFIGRSGLGGVLACKLPQLGGRDYSISWRRKDSYSFNNPSSSTEENVQSLHCRRANH